MFPVYGEIPIDLHDTALPPHLKPINNSVCSLIRSGVVRRDWIGNLRLG